MPRYGLQSRAASTPVRTPTTPGLLAAATGQESRVVGALERSADVRHGREPSTAGSIIVLLQEMAPVALWILENPARDLIVRGVLEAHRAQRRYVEADDVCVGKGEQDRGMGRDHELALAGAHELGHSHEQGELALWDVVRELVDRPTRRSDWPREKSRLTAFRTGDHGSSAGVDKYRPSGPS